MSFQEYLKEQDELMIIQADDERKSKISDFVKTIEDLNDEKFKDFAVNELGMSEDEAQVVVYKMLRDFILSNDKDGDGEPDGDEIDIDVDIEDDMDDDIDVDLD